MSAADFHARQHAAAHGMSIGDTLRSGRRWFAASREEGAALVMAATRAPDPSLMTTAEVGAAFAPPAVKQPTNEEAQQPPVADVKAARHAKAKAVLHRSIQRSRGAQECALIVTCPRHAGTSEMDVTVSYGHAGHWMLESVPTGCSVETHTMTWDERAVLTERIDVAFDNWMHNQEEPGSPRGTA